MALKRTFIWLNYPTDPIAACAKAPAAWRYRRDLPATTQSLSQPCRITSYRKRFGVVSRRKSGGEMTDQQRARDKQRLAQLESQWAQLTNQVAQERRTQMQRAAYQRQAQTAR